MRRHAIRYLAVLIAVLAGTSFPAFAQLSRPTVTVNVAGSGTGTVRIRPWSDNLRFDELTAIPDHGSVFAGWSSSCVYTYEDTCLLQVFPPLRGLTVTATFDIQTVVPTPVNLTVTKAGNGRGTVTSDIGLINCGSLCSARYPTGTVVTLTAAADAGQTFAGWSGGGCSGTSACVVTQTTTVTATFMTLAPNTTIDSGPSNLSSDGRPVFTFSSPDSASAFRCQLDGQPFASCTSPYPVSVASGPHTFAVVAIGAGGNADPTPDTYSWTVVDTTLDPNQHGLTGFWYEPASSGQGLMVEVFPDRSPGNGQMLVGWFTYDTVAGGADRQRWYTLAGAVIGGESDVSLTIFRNTGGNFNAPPATTAQVVGTATLRFATCSSGSLSYMFTDGSARAGTVELTHLLSNATCSVDAPYPADADFALSGSWYGGTATSGQGFMAEVAPTSGAFFLSWFTYIPNGATAGAEEQRWYTAQGAFAKGQRTIPVQIYETTGGVFDTPTPPGQKTVSVGTGTMTYESCTAATFIYDFTGGTSIGLSGSIALSRTGPTPPGCAPTKKGPPRKVPRAQTG